MLAVSSNIHAYHTQFTVRVTKKYKGNRGYYSHFLSKVRSSYIDNPA